MFFDEQLRQYEDVFFLSMFASYNPTITLYDNYCDYYRINPNSISHSYNKCFNSNFNYFCNTFAKQFNSSDKFMSMLNSIVFNICLPVRCWLSFKRLHWIDGINFLKIDFLTNNLLQKNDWNAKYYDYYKKNNLAKLYFKLNILHVFKWITKKR